MFLPDGHLPDPLSPTDEAEPADDAPAALWRLPPAGEANVVGSRAGGIGPTGGRPRRGHVVVGAKERSPAPSPTRRRGPARAARKARKIGVVLHAAHPVRYWDSDSARTRNGCSRAPCPPTA